MVDQVPDEPAWVRTMTNVPLFVGMVANSWSKLESAMVPLTNQLLRTADYRVGKIVLFGLPAAAKGNLLRALTEISSLTPERKAKISNFCTEFDRLRALRNDIVHGRWDRLSDSGAPILHTSKVRGSFKERFQEKEVAWLIKTRNQIEELVGVVFDLGTVTGSTPGRAHDPITPPMEGTMADTDLGAFAREMRATREELAALRQLVEKHLPGIHQELVAAREERAAIGADAEAALQESLGKR